VSSQTPSSKTACRQDLLAGVLHNQPSSGLELCRFLAKQEAPYTSRPGHSPSFPFGFQTRFTTTTHPVYSTKYIGLLGLAGTNPSESPPQRSLVYSFTTDPIPLVPPHPSPRIWPSLVERERRGSLRNFSVAICRFCVFDVLFRDWNTLHQGKFHPPS
jgi:hypothetical protein